MNRLWPAVLVAAVVSVGLGACSAGDSRPTAFDDMADDEVGCVVDYAGERYEVGPLGSSDAETVEPNLYTSFRIGRTAQHVTLAIETDRSESHSQFRVSDITSGGVVVIWGSFEDGGNPGYEVRCWGPAESS